MKKIFSLCIEGAKSLSIELWRNPSGTYVLRCEGRDIALLRANEQSELIVLAVSQAESVTR
jgi:hypothetical protein